MGPQEKEVVWTHFTKEDLLYRDDIPDDDDKEDHDFTFIDCKLETKYSCLVKRRLRYLQSYWSHKYDQTNKVVENQDADSEQELYPENYANQLSLLLLFPLLESQGKSDITLVKKTVDLLLASLNSAKFLPKQSLEGLENLIISWLKNPRYSDIRTTLASSLVALATTCGDISSIIKTISSLDESDVSEPLPVGNYLQNLNPIPDSNAFSVPTKIKSKWKLSSEISSVGSSKDFVYISTEKFGIQKVGNGKYSTIRGILYATNSSLPPGKIVYGDKSFLLHYSLGVIRRINADNLEVLNEIQTDSNTQIILSDGIDFYEILYNEEKFYLVTFKINQNGEKETIKTLCLEGITDSLSMASIYIDGTYLCIIKPAKTITFHLKNEVIQEFETLNYESFRNVSYDPFNHSIWAVSSNLQITEYEGAGYASLSDCLAQLAISETEWNLNDKEVDIRGIKSKLLYHAGIFGIVAPETVRSELNEAFLNLFDESKDSRSWILCCLKILKAVKPKKEAENKLRRLIYSKDEKISQFSLDAYYDLLETKEKVEILKNPLANEVLKTKILESIEITKDLIMNNEDLLLLLFKEIVNEDFNLIKGTILEYSLPKVSTRLKFVSEAIDVLCHSIISSETPLENQINLFSGFLNTFYSEAKQFLTALEEKSTVLKSKLDKILPSTHCGSLLLTICTVMSHHSMDFYKEADDLSSLLHLTGSLSNIQNPNVLGTVRIPPSYFFQINTPHPLPPKYLKKEILHFPDWQYIYLRCDPRSFTGSDKLVLSIGSRRVGDFGGGGSSWPLEIHRIQGGHPLTLTFQNNSNEPHWGFKIQLARYDSTLKRSRNLPFFCDVALSLSSLLVMHCSSLYSGPPITDMEKECEALLASDLLRRCVWKTETEDYHLPRMKLSSNVLSKVKSTLNMHFPVIRKSLLDIIKPTDLYEGILSVVAKHLSMTDIIMNLSEHESSGTPEYYSFCEVVKCVHQRISALIRKLQVLGDLENRWELEVESLKDGTSQMNDLFFKDYHHNESNWKELKLLTFLKNVEEEESMGKAVEKLKLVIEKEFHTHLSQKKLSLTSLIVQGIFERIELLMQVDIKLNKPFETGMTQSMGPWPQKLQRQISMEMERSLDDSILKVTRKKSKNKAPQSCIEDLFEFIGSHPEKAASSTSFLESIKIRKMRSKNRIKSLKLMIKALSLDLKGMSSHIVRALVPIVIQGPKVEDVSCGGGVTEIRNCFSEFLTKVIIVSSGDPHETGSSIKLLCSIPYEREDERLLVKSGLVSLLDKFCSMDSPELSKLAWSCFKSLSNICVSWENDESFSKSDEFNSLARQLSSLLTHHLIHGTSLENGTDDLQEVLSLLNNLSKSKIGQDILCQPPCISKLLELLLEPISPRMILSVIRLCSASLPYMNEESVSKIEIPKWVHGPQRFISKNYTSIMELLLTRLGDFLVPGCPVRLAQSSIQLNKFRGIESQNSFNGPEEVIDSSTLSLRIHKSQDKSTHDIMQELLSVNAELKIFTAGDMNKMVALDKNLTRFNETELTTNDATSILQLGTKLAQKGFIVSVGPPKSQLEETKDACKERNLKLENNDPVRPFISEQVANNLAAELIGLLHKCIDTIWSSSLESLLEKYLNEMKSLICKAEDLFEAENHELFPIFSNGKKVLSTLAVLGGFEETIKPGLHVILNGKKHDMGVVSRFLGGKDILVMLPSGEKIKVNKNNVTPKCNLSIQGCKLFNKLLSYEISEAISSLLLPSYDTGIDPLSSALPAGGDGQSLKMNISRLFAKIRTQSCFLLSLYSKNEQFSELFIRESYTAVDMLVLLSKDALPTDSSSKLFKARNDLHSLYRDCIKVPALKELTMSRKVKNVKWDPSRSYPRTQSIFFNNKMCSFTYHGREIPLSAALPKGVFLYSNTATVANGSFYFEIEIQSLGETGSEENITPSLSIGLAPYPNEEDEGTSAWTNPIGSLLFHNNGRAVHYKGTSLLQWRSLRFDIRFSPSDHIGILRDKTDVKFTYNGVLLNQYLTDITGDLYPVVHVQRKGLRLKTNFGQNTFTYSGYVPSTIAPVSSESESDGESNSTNFYGFNEDSSSALGGRRSSSAGHFRGCSIGNRIALKTKCKPVYDVESSMCFASAIGLTSTYTGIQKLAAPLDDDSDDDEDDSDNSNAEEEFRQQDLHSLLVKAWEAKIFPLIRRRFRNESERRDGLEQIKGALALGMTDIARQTVEFLYEENGSIPPDLHLPTLDDIKEDLAKLSIDRIKKGQSVMVSSLLEEESALKFGSPAICRTIGLQGTVLEIDSINDLVMLEFCLEFEGVLVRYWYPIGVLEKPPDSITGSKPRADLSSVLLHKELLNAEYALSRFHCRTSYLNLIHFAFNADLKNFEEDNTMCVQLLILKDQDFDEIKLLSDSSLRKSIGNLLYQNLETGSQKLMAESHSLLNIFYEEPECLVKKLSKFLSNSVTTETLDSITECLVSPSQYFTTEEIVINDLSILKSVIRFKEAAFILISLKFSEECFDNQYESSLQVHVQTFNGDGLKKNGRRSAIDSVQYPLSVYGNYSKERSFQSALLSEDLIRISHGGGGENNNISLVMQGIHSDFPLVIAVAHAALQIDNKELIQDISEKLCLFLWKYPAPPLLKEKLFRLLGKLLKSYSYRKLPHPELFTLLYNELGFLKEKNQSYISSYFKSLFFLLYDVSNEHFQPKELNEYNWFFEAKSLLDNIKNSNYTTYIEQAGSKDYAKLLVLVNLPTELSNECLRSCTLEIVDSQGGTTDETVFVSDVQGRRGIVISVKFSQKIDSIKELLVKSETFRNSIVSKVNEDYTPVRSEATEPLLKFLKSKTVTDEGEMTPKFKQSIEDIFNQISSNEEYVSKAKICELNPKDKLTILLQSWKQNSSSILGTIQDMMSLGTFKDNERILRKNQFIDFIKKNLTKDASSLAKGIIQCGYSLNMEIVSSSPNNITHAELKNLREEIDKYAKDYSLDPFSINPYELKGYENLIIVLQNINKYVINSNLLNLMDYEERSVELAYLRSLLFHTVRAKHLESSIFSRNNPELTPIEIVLDPVENIGIIHDDRRRTWFHGAMTQLNNHNSNEFCVPLASGGDPPLPFHPRMAGEEVLGHSGSFRQFMCRIVEELESTALPILSPIIQESQKQWVLRPGKTLSHEALLIFLGQIMGMCLRTRIPLALNLAHYSWKAFCNIPLDWSDVKTSYPSYYLFIEELRSLKTEDEFDDFIEQYEFPKMTYFDISGTEEELIPDGSKDYLSWTNRDQFLKLSVQRKMSEMESKEEWASIRAGMSTIIPTSIIGSLFGPSEISELFCGSHYININYLKTHTIYQAGITENQPHVQFFWKVLRSFSQTQIGQFIKFASNQDRIQTSHLETIPPYPMKIAPANIEEEDNPDNRHIRVETCMFMIKLPKYSTHEIMKERILFAISSALDPLSG